MKTPEMANIRGNRKRNLTQFVKFLKENGLFKIEVGKLPLRGQIWFATTTSPQVGIAFSF